METDSNNKSPKKLLGSIKNELNKDRHLSTERLKSLLEQIEKLVHCKGIDINILNQGAEVFKTVLHKTEDPIILEYCLKSAENASFKYSKVAKNRMLSFVRKHFESNTLTKVFAFWPTSFTMSLIGLFNDDLLTKLNDEQKETLNDYIVDAFQHGENEHIRDISFRLIIGMKLQIPIESNPKSVIRFVKFISKMRNEKNAEWANYWKALVINCGVALHSQMEILNALLDVVEHAFRNTTDINDRLLGFDCWKVLIDNASLDMDHLCSKKQLKLLLIPLKAKLSRQETVVIKRFSLFVYLMEKLQEHAILCLDDFLEFSFGNVGENSDTNKCGQGKTVEKLWKPSIDVLETILGEERPNYKLRRIVTSENIYKKHRIVINSVFEASYMINNEAFEGGSFKADLLKHLWTLLITTILSNNNEQEVNVCLEYIFEIATKTDAKKSESFSNLLWSLFAEIFSGKSLDSSKKFEFFLMILNNCFGAQVPQIKSVTLMNKVLDSLKVACIADNKKLDKVIEIVLSPDNLFKSIFLWNLWATIGECIIHSVILYKFNREEKYIEFIMWPILHNDSQYYASIDIVRKTWSALFKKLKNVRKSEVLSKFKNITNNEVVKYFIQEIAFSKNRNLNSENAGRILRLIEAFLIRETAQNSLKTTAMILNYFLINDVSSAAKYFEDLSNVKTLCNCVKITMQVEFFNILNSLFILINRITNEKTRESFHCHLTPHLYEILSRKKKLNENVRTTINELVSLLNWTEESKIKKRKSEGKDNLTVQILSPTKIQINSTQSNSTTLPTTSRSKKIVDSVKKIPNIPVDEESSSKFVLIESRVILDPTKLNDHQKEMMKRRREDIPALYEDLTQSQSSNDFFTQKVIEKQTEESEKETQQEKTTQEEEQTTQEDKNTQDDENVRKDNEVQKEDEENVKNRDTEKMEDETKSEEEKKKLRIERELRKIQMNIVGAEEYNNSAGTRTSRGKNDSNFMTLDYVFDEEISDEIVNYAQLNQEVNGNNNTEKRVEPVKIPKRNALQPRPRRKRKFLLSLAKKKPNHRQSLDFKKVVKNKNLFLNKSSDQLGLNDSTEDIIESSQETQFKRKVAEILLNEIEDIKLINEEKPMAEEDAITQIATADTTTSANVINEMPETPELSESERTMANCDTISVTSQDESMKDSGKSETEIEDLLQKTPSTPLTKRSLPTSPVTGETPNRTDEFLNDTLNISPIQIENSPPKEKTSPPKEKTNNNRNERSDRLLNLVNVNLKRLTKQPLPVLMSPSLGNIRMKKLMFNCPQIENQVETTTQTNTNDILTFSRDVPSPLALPKNGILKRKHSEIAGDDFSSPCAKRKRVNFSDPILTSEKLIFKDDNEFIKDHNDTPSIVGVSANEFDELFVAQNCDIEDAIYPDLINCKENVSVVLKDIEPEVSEALVIKGIATVGDLAGLSKTELSNIPFKETVDVASLLRDYYEKQTLEEDKDISFEEQIVIDVEAASNSESPIIEEPATESTTSSVDEFIESLKENPEKRSDFLNKLKDTNIFDEEELQNCFARKTTDTEMSVPEKNYEELFSVIKTTVEDDIMKENLPKLFSDILDLMRVKLSAGDVYNLLSESLKNVFLEAVNKK